MLNKKVIGMIRLFRPELPFAAGVCVLLGEIIALGRFPSVREAVLGFASVFFISGSALILNDYFDLEVDKINAPNRPLPSGLVSPAETVILTVMTIFLGLAAAVAINLPAFILCIIAGVVGILYNWKFKEAGLLGNLMVSTSVALTFILGGVAVGRPWNQIVWTFSLIAFLIDLGEEIAGDAMDMEGDKKRGSKSIALLAGKKFSLRLSGSLFGLVVLISLIPVLLRWLGLSYLIMILIMDAIIIVFTVRLLRSKTPDEGRQSMRRIYLGALVGMLAFLIGQFFE
jgi:geranylgeranylglycerol-phosphate geranylgeranyltransferase